MAELPVFYTKYYCEENIYNLLLVLDCDISTGVGVFDNAFAVLFSTYKTAASQEVANKWVSHVPYRPYKRNDCDDLLLWDYHVVAVVRSRNTKAWFVIDFDSDLRRLVPPGEDLQQWTPYCTDLQLYVDKTFFIDRDDRFNHFDNLTRLSDMIRLRIIEYKDYLCFLRTDRSHMLNESGEYNATPPPQPPITSAPSHLPESLIASYAEVEQTLDSPKKKNNLVCFVNMNNTLFPGKIVDRYEFADIFTKMP